MGDAKRISKRIAKMVPLLGSCVEYHYDPDASWGDFGKSLGIDAAFCMMPIPGGGAVKAVGKAAKTAAAGIAEKVASTALKTVGKAEVGASAGRVAVAKAEIAAANQAATDAFRKNVQKNLLEKGAGAATNKAPYNPKKTQNLATNLLDSKSFTSKHGSWTEHAKCKASGAV